MMTACTTAAAYSAQRHRQDTASLTGDVVITGRVMPQDGDAKADRTASSLDGLNKHMLGLRDSHLPGWLPVGVLTVR